MSHRSLWNLGHEIAADQYRDVCWGVGGGGGGIRFFSD